jgi:hypothetical protein
MNIEEQIKSVDTLLDQLESETVSFIEYGDPRHPGMYLSHIRVRYLMTPAGMQFAIKELHLGMEGSGDYFHPSLRDDLKAELIKRLVRYHRPNPLVQALRERLYPEAKDTPLSFFPRQDADQPFCQMLYEHAQSL